MTIRFTRTRSIRAGKGGEAMDVSARWRDYFIENHDLDVCFGVQQGGPMGTVFFYADFEDWNHASAIGAAMWADERYVALEAEADEVFLQGGQETIVLIQ